MGMLHYTLYWKTGLITPASCCHGNKRARDGLEGKGFIGMEIDYGRGLIIKMQGNLFCKLVPYPREILLDKGFWLSYDMATTAECFIFYILHHQFALRILLQTGHQIKLRSIEVSV